jgi:PII-like signaling protein
MMVSWFGDVEACMSGELIQRVRIYLNERDTYEGRALYVAILEQLLREGATGATALRGMAGFGPGLRMRASGIGSVTDAQPIVIEWVDRVDRVGKILASIEGVAGEALITIEDVRAYRARLRSNGPFGNLTVADQMDTTIVTAPTTALLRDGVRALLLRTQPLLPLVNEQRQLAGVVGSNELQHRGGIGLPLAIMRAMRPNEREDLIRTFGERPLYEIALQEPRAIYAQSSIPQAVATMIEWGVDYLPVIDRDGHVVGGIGIAQALTSALNSMRATDTNGAVQDADHRPRVRMLMQTSMVSMPAESDAGEALSRLLVTTNRCVVLTDDRLPVGLLDPVGVLERLEPPTRYAWLHALRSADQRQPALPFEVPTLRASELSYPPALISEDASDEQAIQLMIEGQHEWLVVVNAEQQLVGLIGQRGLLRALAQQSG